MPREWNCKAGPWGPLKNTWLLPLRADSLLEEKAKLMTKWTLMMCWSVQYSWYFTCWASVRGHALPGFLTIGVTPLSPITFRRKEGPLRSDPCSSSALFPVPWVLQDPSPTWNTLPSGLCSVLALAMLLSLSRCPYAFSCWPDSRYPSLCLAKHGSAHGAWEFTLKETAFDLIA